MVGWDQKPSDEEFIILVYYGRDAEIIKTLVNEAVEFNIEQDKGYLSIYEVCRWAAFWVKSVTKQARPLDSVLLDSNLMETLVEDIKNFRTSAEWYVDKGVPYRRGYLLYGPPGTGKTSFTSAVAGALKLNLCYLNLSSGDLDDDSLNSLLSTGIPNSIVLLEDIDALFKSREQMKVSGLSFSGFLNALDGVRS